MGRPTHAIVVAKRRAMRQDACSTLLAIMKPSGSINLNALQTFYFVAKHGGISAARGQMPYGLTDAAIRAQLKQLQSDARCLLIGRDPFHLTAAGETLLSFIEPFFAQLDAVIARLETADLEILRVGGTRVVFRSHFPRLLEVLRPQFLHLTCVMREGLRPEVNEWFARRAIDLAITVLEGPTPAGCQSELLMRLPMELLVHRKSRVTSLASLLKPRRIELPLVTPFREDHVTRAFHRGMVEQGVEWTSLHEVASLDVISELVAAGVGAGLSLAVPGRVLPPEVRALPLADLPLIDVGLIWRPGRSRALAAMLAGIRLLAAQVAPPPKPKKLS